MMIEHDPKTALDDKLIPMNRPYEVRDWEEGKLLIFDDTIEHEAWNDSNEDRILLIFDIWRPELSDQEQREIDALFSGPTMSA